VVRLFGEGDQRYENGMHTRSPRKAS
jgi:hypothetical protein